MKTLQLKKDEDRRIRVGHLWIFSNEIDAKATPLEGFEPGQVVRVEDFRGRALGLGYVNPRSLIGCRMLSRDPSDRPDAAFFRERLTRALSLRAVVCKEPFHRLVHGESDLLPGLVVDRYGDVLVAQVGSAGMERLWPVVEPVLVELLAPKGILLKNDSPSRELEGLAREVRVAYGVVPEEVEVLEGGVRLVVSLSAGQKTGFYFDMRENRARAAGLVPALAPGAQVLDAFSYVGAFGVRAALNGAGRVLCLDASEKALEHARRNARLNGVEGRMEFVCADAFEALQGLPANGFSLVSLDPPALVKRKKDLGAGRKAYERLNAQAARLLSDGGFLLTASCSQHLAVSEFKRAILAGAQGAFVQILWQGGQAMDHPVHPAMPETEYLKAFLCRVSRRGSGSTAQDG